MIFMKTQSNFYLFLIALISAMGGFLFGYDWVVIGGAKPFYEQYFGIAGNPVMQGWAMSSALIGCLFGALSAGKLSDRLGRKPILILAAGLFICTAVGTGAVHSFTFFNVFRLVGGFAIGIASSLSPMYIAEIAPAHLRGRFVSINQLTVVLGILTSQIVNWQIAEPVALGATHEMIRESWNGQMGWRWMFWAMTVPAALFFVFSFILPESPRWLASSGKREAALKVFTRMGGKEYAVTELAAIEAASACQTQEGGFRQLLNPAMYKVLTIGVVMAILQQWCGINVIFNYAQEIFMAAGYGVSDVLMNIVVTGITNVIFTILAMFVVDRWGRKALTLIGSFGLAIIYSFMGAAYYFHITGIVLLIIVVMAIACYAMTLATVMWVIISEIFPNRIRGVAMSVCTFALWAACFILTYTFPMLNSGLGAAGTFWLYGLICLGGGIFVVFRLPETKGKSLEEIEKGEKETHEKTEELKTLLFLMHNKLSPILLGVIPDEADIHELQEYEELAAYLRNALNAILQFAEKKIEEVGIYEVVAVVASKTGIPIGKIQSQEKERLLNMEEYLRRRVVGQDQALKTLTDAILESRSGMNKPGQPIGSFFLLGPTGTGKTELAKALAEALFNDEKSMIRFDMSEFKEEHSAALLYGAPPGYVGYEEGGMLVNKIRQQPYAVVLFDEIEKAHPSVYDIFLQIMDEGKLHDRLGKEGDFSNSIVLFTSNVGSEWLTSQLESGNVPPTTQIMEVMGQYFRPEFLARLSEIVPFSPIREEILLKIFDIQFNGVRKLLDKQGIGITISDDARKMLAHKGFTPKYGARQVAGVIRNYLRRPISRLIINEELGKGKSLEVGLDEQNELTWNIHQ